MSSSSRFWKPTSIQDDDSTTNDDEATTEITSRKRQRGPTTGYNVHLDKKRNNNKHYNSNTNNSNNNNNNNVNNKNNHHLPPTMEQYRISQQRMLLPIFKYKKQILYAIEHYSILIIVGETGCGKSTQLVQYFYEYGWAENNFQIVCTQPYSTSIQSLCQHINNEIMNSSNNTKNLDDDNDTPIVGYSIDGYDTRSSSTSSSTEKQIQQQQNCKIMIVTNNSLIYEALTIDPLLSKYSIIIIDDAYVRTIDIDLLLGILKKIQQLHRKTSLRIVICTTTSNDALQFLNYFNISDTSTTSNNTTTTTTITKQNNKISSSSTNGQKDVNTVMTIGDNNNPTVECTNTTTSDTKINEKQLKGGTIISVDRHYQQQQQQQQQPLQQQLQHYSVDVLHVQQPISDYIVSMIDIAYKIYIIRNEPGDILCFLPTIDTITTAIKYAEEIFFSTDTTNNKNKLSPTDIDFVPVHDKIPYKHQLELMKHPITIIQQNVQQRRRIIFATNIAECTISIPNIVHVIDSGLIQLSYFDPINGIYRSIVCPISQSCAIQRTRCCAIKNKQQHSEHTATIGKCYRLYTESYYKSTIVPIHVTPPEISRCDVTKLILIIKSLGIDNILTFDLLDIPNIESLVYGLEILYALNAIDDTTTLTNHGWTISSFPVNDVRIAQMLIESINYGCSWEVLAIASVIHIDRPLFINKNASKNKQYSKSASTRYDNNKNNNDYDKLMKNIIDPSGDHVTYVNIISDMDDHYYTEQECIERYYNYYNIKLCIYYRNYLAKFIKQKFHRIQSYVSTNNNATTSTSNTITGKRSKDIDINTRNRSLAIRRCITAGYFVNVAKLYNDGKYYTLKNHLHVTPSVTSIFTTHSTRTSTSTLSSYHHADDSSIQYIIFTKTNDTTRGTVELVNVSSIEAKWLRELAPHYWE